MDSLDWIGDELIALDDASLLRVPTVVGSASGAEIEIGGRRLVLACSNNYLGLAADERVTAAAAAAALRWGAGSGASPLVSGLTRLGRDLERRLAAFKSSDDAVIFSSGFLANLGVIGALVGAGDVVFSDELNHASIIDGCRLSKARVEVYRHGDVDHLDALLGAGRFERALVATDTVFSMDGDLAPLPSLVEVAHRHGAMTMVDEAHGTGVLGRSGGGAVEHFGLEGQVDAVVGTLSKALGSAGGFVAGSERLCSWIRNRARPFIFDTAPAPAALGAAGAALEIIESEPWRRERLAEVREEIAGGLRRQGFDVLETVSAVIPVIVGESADALALAAAIQERGVFAPAIRPPTVAAGTARIRLSAMATFTDENVATILGAFESLDHAGESG